MSWKGTRPQRQELSHQFHWLITNHHTAAFMGPKLPFTFQEEMVFSKSYEKAKGSITELDNL